MQGHYVRTLGNIGDKDTENEVLLLEHDIPHARFSETVLLCLPDMPWSISKEVSAGCELRPGKPVRCFSLVDELFL